MCNACVEACEGVAAGGSGKGAGNGKAPLHVKGDDTKFIFEFETDGAISAKDTLNTALEILEDKFSTFRDQVSDLD